MPNKQNSKIGLLAKPHGFTLIELIIGIVVLAISFSVITSLVIPTTIQSANQLHQIRAAELGQTLMNEILAKSFDENSDHVGGALRCGETGANACTSTSAGTGNFGSDTGETSRALFDDVDDYHGLIESGTNIQNSEGSTMGDLYLGYEVRVDVIYDSNYDDVADQTGDPVRWLAKRIKVDVVTPSQDTLTFSTYKVNF